MASEIGERLWGQACDDAASTSDWLIVKSLEDAEEVEFLEGLIDYAKEQQADSHVEAVLRMELDIIRRSYTAQSEADRTYLEVQMKLLEDNNKQLYKKAVLLRHSYSSHLLKKHEARYPLRGTQRIPKVQDTDPF